MIELFFAIRKGHIVCGSKWLIKYIMIEWSFDFWDPSKNKVPQTVANGMT